MNKIVHRLANLYEKMKNDYENGEIRLMANGNYEN